MRVPLNLAPTFNLWDNPWITLEDMEGGTEQLGIGQVLEGAHRYLAIHDSSPLVVVGIHRLLTAILQHALDPREIAHIREIWDTGRFPVEKLAEFAGRYRHRFDLFSDTEPFMQSAEIGLAPTKTDRVKPVGYLAADSPTGTEITHYRHGREDDQVFCPACCAAGLTVVPAFATTGGSGIKPSINGVPPIYVMPGGKNLFQSLAASLVLPNNQPKTRCQDRDEAWWLRDAIVGRGEEVYEVGYLHSLTFPARRVRLHPTPMVGLCTRCGQSSVWGVSTMVFDMGETRPKEHEIWQDPFAAYRYSNDDKPPTPIRPQAGRAIWREFGSLFLQAEDRQDSSKLRRTQRPAVLSQMGETGIWGDQAIRPIHCVGLRTDMKAKIFEWVDWTFEVPPVVLSNERAADAILKAIVFAEDCGRIIAQVFRRPMGDSPNTSKRERHKELRPVLDDVYWSALPGPFRTLVLDTARPDRRERAGKVWLDQVMAAGNRAFAQTAAQVGDDGESLRWRVQGELACAIKLAQRKTKEVPSDE
jgi:CRISPR system Cascade subunit CasA